MRWRFAHSLKPHVAVGMLLAIGLLFLVLLSVAFFVQLLWGLVSLALVLWLRRRLR